MSNLKESLEFDDLDPAQQKSIYWGFLWRAAAMSLLSLVAGIVAAFSVNLVVQLAGNVVGVDVTTYPWLMTLLAVCVGTLVNLCGWWYYTRWLFMTQFGAFRLRLVREGANAV